MWTEEEVSQSFGQAVFVMLFKNKGSSNDPSKCRCVGLLNHDYKTLSIIILGRIKAPKRRSTYKIGSPGFTNGGDAEMTFIFCGHWTLVCQVMAKDKHIVVTHVDYSVEFDGVSHKYIDKALTDVGPGPYIGKS